MSYKHLNITEREKILAFMAMGWSICQIAKKLVNLELFTLVEKLFLERRWSPEQKLRGKERENSYQQ